MFEQYKQLLQEFIRFKSISTDANFQSEIKKAVDWLKNLFQVNGFQVQVFEGYDNPIVLASYQVDPNLKTALIYGHYDVQPAEKADGWNSEPFELTERENRLFARGAIDNKGQVMVHLVNAFEQIKNKTLGYNLKFLIEGNEETGSGKIEKFIQDNQELLKANFVLLSDGEISGGQPNLEVGFRGGFNLTLTVKTGKVDLHSGIFGSAAPNALHELFRILNQIFDWQENKIVIPEFYDSVEPVDEEIKKNNRQIPFKQSEYEKMTGCKALLLEQGNDFYTQTGLRPAIEITGLVGGYAGEGYKNAIPYQAQAKINFRLTAEQKPEKVFELFKNWLAKIMPEYLDFELEQSSPYEGVKLEINNQYVEKAKQVLEQVWQDQVIFKYVGGGLPIVTYFNQILQIPQLLVPLASEDCAMHGANENFDLGYWQKAMAFSEQFLKSNQ
ncbi:MAG: M20/M25/M40 family metallo-hydrolase [Patescibacteria group bacterium]